jgi:hypothetical protein
MLPNIALAWMMTQIKDFLDIDSSIIKADPRDVEMAAALQLEGEANPDSGKSQQATRLDATLTIAKVTSRTPRRDGSRSMASANKEPAHPMNTSERTPQQ